MDELNKIMKWFFILISILILFVVIIKFELLEYRIEKYFVTKKYNNFINEINEYEEMKKNRTTTAFVDPRIELAENCYQDYLKYSDITRRKRKLRKLSLLVAFNLWIDLGDTTKMSRVLNDINLEDKKDICFNLGSQFVRQNKYNIAREYFEKILDLDPTARQRDRIKNFMYEMESLSIGKQAPFFEAKDINGKKRNLNEFKDKIVLLQFIGSWCPSCYDKLPYIEKVYQKYQNEDFIIVGMGLEKTFENFKKYIKDEKIKWLMLYCDGKSSRRSKIAKLYNVNTGSKNFLIGKDCKILNKDIAPGDLYRIIGNVLNIN